MGASPLTGGTSVAASGAQAATGEIGADAIRAALEDDPSSLVDDLALLPDSHEVLSTRALADEANRELRASNRSLSLIAQRFDACLLDFLADLARRCPRALLGTMSRLTAGAYFGTAMRGGQRMKRQIGHLAGGLLCLASADAEAAGGLMQHLALPPSAPGAALEPNDVFLSSEAAVANSLPSSGAGGASAVWCVSEAELEAEVDEAVHEADLPTDMEKTTLRLVLLSIPVPGCAPDAPQARAGSQDISKTWLWQGLLDAKSSAVRHRLSDMLKHCILSAVVPSGASHDESLASGATQSLSGWRALRADVYRWIVAQDLEAIRDQLQA